ncbi:MAG: hypothetical protein ACQCN5_04795 [Candidatus Bathyarchaeia archaeon]|jgi:hypothetical protein
MIQVKNVAQGFLVTASAICLLETFQMQYLYLNQWLGSIFFVVSAGPLAANFFMAVNRFRAEKTIQAKVIQTKNVLMALQGFGFACWFFDVLSTTLVIDVQHAGSELNPLGWPLSALGALAYFVPITFVTYYLLFKLKTKESFYGAVALTGVSIFMGLRNLGASLFNLSGLGGFSGYPEEISVLCIWIILVAILTTLNLVIVVKNKKKDV